MKGGVGDHVGRLDELAVGTVLHHRVLQDPSRSQGKPPVRTPVRRRVADSLPPCIRSLIHGEAVCVGRTGVAVQNHHDVGVLRGGPLLKVLDEAGIDVGQDLGPARHRRDDQVLAPCQALEQHLVRGDPAPLAELGLLLRRRAVPPPSLDELERMELRVLRNAPERLDLPAPLQPAVEEVTPAGRRNEQPGQGTDAVRSRIIHVAQVHRRNIRSRPPRQPTSSPPASGPHHSPPERTVNERRPRTQDRTNGPSGA